MRKKANDERIIVGKTHRAVTEAEIGFAHGCNAPGKRFQHLQRAFAGRTKAQNAAKEHNPAEWQLRQGGDFPEVHEQNVRRGFTQRLAHSQIGRWIIQTAQRAYGQHKIGEAAGHYEASVVSAVVESQHADARWSGGCQPAFRVARQHQMPDRGICLEEKGQCTEALGTVARTRQRNHQRGTHGRYGLDPMRDQGAPADYTDWDTQSILEGQTNALTDIFGAAGTGQNDVCGAVDQRLKPLRIRNN